MPLNRSRVDVLCVPLDVERQVSPSEWRSVVGQWRRDGLLEADRPTPALVEGGAKGIRLDRPTGPVVYGNQLGGFRVSCPSCGKGMARAFAAAMEQARRRGTPHGIVCCPSCAHASPLMEVEARPPIRIGRCAIELADVEGVTLTEAGRRAFEQLVGPMKVILRRTS